MDIVQPGKESIKFISSLATESSDQLLVVKYQRAQPQSPQFMSVYQGMDQSVNITVTTVVVRAAPEPVITLYDFIMTTFVPEGQASQSAIDSMATTENDSDATEIGVASLQKIKVVVKLAGVQGMFCKNSTNCVSLIVNSHHRQQRDADRYTLDVYSGHLCRLTLEDYASKLPVGLLVRDGRLRLEDYCA
jgi:vacuolar protein sorting-associated protein 13A/C